MSGATSTIEKQIETFATGPESEYAFPADLRVEERKLVKSAAEKFGLSTKSFGMGGERKIHIFKPGASTVASPPEKLSTKVNQEEEVPLNSQSGGSTADSDSDAQDPTISIKNSFVHFEGDSDENGDPRIIQSMPNGKFAESLKADKQVTKSAGYQKNRPLPVSQDPEPEVERLAGIEIPATPDAETSFGTVPFDTSVPCSANEQSVAAPNAQWPQAATSQDVTVLAPASWTPQTPLQNLMAATAAACAAPQGSSVTVLQPACWSQTSRSYNDSFSVPQVPPQIPPPSLMPSLEEATPSSFLPGTAVVLHGLASQPAFNGLCGTVSSYDADCARYNIMVDVGPNAARRMVKVKFQNLLPAQPVLPPQPQLLPPQLPLPQQPCYPSGPHAGYSHGPHAPSPVKATLTLDAMI